MFQVARSMFYTTEAEDDHTKRFHLLVREFLQDAPEHAIFAKYIQNFVVTNQFNLHLKFMIRANLFQISKKIILKT